MKKQRNRLSTLMLPVAVVLISIVAYQYGYVALKAQMSSLKEEQAAKEKTLMKQSALVATKPEMEQKLALLKEERKAENAKLFDGQTPSISTAALLETVKAIVAGRNGKIQSERAGKPEAFEKFTLITASIDVVLPDPGALGDVLHALETRVPCLLVKDLDVRVRNLNDPKELSVRMDVCALSGGAK